MQQMLKIFGLNVLQNDQRLGTMKVVRKDLSKIFRASCQDNLDIEGDDKNLSYVLLFQGGVYFMSLESAINTSSRVLSTQDGNVNQIFLF